MEQAIRARYPKVLAWATDILRELYGPDATFRPGQYEAIESTCTRRRTLVVQRTGWGKSLVYFVSTKMLRARGHGITLVVSSLISLMENQLAAARKLGLSCEMLNGSVDRDERPNILGRMVEGACDLVFITPETMFTPDVQEALPSMRISLFVIDEAHCISDWGHDFRLEYTRLRTVIQGLDDTRLLATTATATDAVVEDICVQLGGDVFVSRGPLVRDSLQMQVVETRGIKDKYAWLAANLPLMPGSGIVYCTTTRDCDRLAEFLRGCGLEALPYHAKRDALERRATLARFDANELKCVVATSALGMGYDKDDIAFVVHFQMPSGIVAYYQQIGRAGRKLDQAYAILFAGDETDLAIQRHFIESAFPTEAETLEIMRIVGSGPAGVRYNDILGQSNISTSRVSKALDFLQNDGYVERQGSAYVATGVPFVYDREHYDAITRRRFQELDEMVGLSRSKDCLSQGVVAALGDVGAPACGRCANCRGADVFGMARPDAELMRRVDDFIERDHLRIAPRRRWPSRSLGTLAGDTSTVIRHPNEEGLCLVRVGIGDLGRAAEGYLEGTSGLTEPLIARAVEVLAPVVLAHGVTEIVRVPSTTQARSAEIACALSERLGLPVAEALAKAPAPSQSELNNRFFKCENALRALSAVPGVSLGGCVLLVDDAYDSGWTLAAAGARLQQASPGVAVVPFALAMVGVS